MTALLSLIPAPVWAALMGMVALAVAWLKGRSDGARGAAAKARDKAAAGYKATTERIRDADTGSGDADDDLDWLRKRGQR